MTFVHSTEKSQIATKIIPVNINQMSTIDMIDSHKKTRNIISNRSLWVIVEIKRLKSSNLRIENQIKKERSLNREKYVRLQELEDEIVSIGSNALASDVLKSLIIEKIYEIKMLKDGLKIPYHEPVASSKVIKLA